MTNSPTKEFYPGIYADEETAKTLKYEPDKSTKGLSVLAKIKTIASRITYRLGWLLAGKRIWNRAIFWVAGNIYLASALPKGKTISLPKGITIADQTLVLSTEMMLDGKGQILTQAVNKPLSEMVLISPDTQYAVIHNVYFVGVEGTRLA